MKSIQERVYALLGTSETPIEEGRLPAPVSKHLDAITSSLRVIEDELRRGNSKGAHSAVDALMGEVKALKSSIPS